MKNLVVEGQITATSKKQNADYKQETPTKTAYITVSDSDAKKLEDFGLVKYSSNENETFFIIKLVKKLMLYFPNGMSTPRHDLSQIEVDGQETNNFKTTDEHPVQLNILKGENLGNEFYRVQAIRVENESDIEEIKPENPFGDKTAF